METSDAAMERRDIAARLRELAAHPDIDGDVYCGCLVDCGLLQWGTYSGHATPESFERLADLIDRPTCSIVATDHEYEDSMRCTRCREVFARPWVPFRYCPYCGAEVVNDA